MKDLGHCGPYYNNSIETECERFLFSAVRVYVQLLRNPKHKM